MYVYDMRVLRITDWVELVEQFSGFSGEVLIVSHKELLGHVSGYVLVNISIFISAYTNSHSPILLLEVRVQRRISHSS